MILIQLIYSTIMKLKGCTSSATKAQRHKEGISIKTFIKKVDTPDTVLMRETQILCRLKFLDKHFDLLINFNVHLIKKGIKKNIL